eukprot:5885723-Pyramimonas_sp.AAC.1
MTDVDMRAFWLDGTLAPASRVDALPIGARPAGEHAAPAGGAGGGPPRERSAPPADPPPQGPTRTPPDPPDSDSSSWIRGW